MNKRQRAKRRAQRWRVKHMGWAVIYELPPMFRDIVLIPGKWGSIRERLQSSDYSGLWMPGSRSMKGTP